MSTADRINRARWSRNQKKRAALVAAGSLLSVEESRAADLNGMLQLEAALIEYPNMAQTLAKVRERIKYLQSTKKAP